MINFGYLKNTLQPPRPDAEPQRAITTSRALVHAWIQQTRGGAWVPAPVSAPGKEWCAAALANYVNGLGVPVWDTCCLPAGIRPADVNLPSYRDHGSAAAFGFRWATRAERERVAPPYRFPRPRSVYSDVEGAEVS